MLTSKKLPPHLESMLRVNQAGEYGAVRIYGGQLKTMRDEGERPIIAQMEEEEKRHLSQFNDLLFTHHVAPTLFTPLWHMGGAALGVFTGFLGNRAIHTCTKAVEDVIEEHYQDQIDALEHDNHPLSPHLREIFTDFRNDELHHKDIAEHKLSETTLPLQLLEKGIKALAKFAIALSKRV